MPRPLKQIPWNERPHLYLVEGETLEDEATRTALQAMYPVIHFADGTVLLGQKPS
jgi:hypothetical protein